MEERKLVEEKVPRKDQAKLEEKGKEKVMVMAIRQRRRKKMGKNGKIKKITIRKRIMRRKRKRTRVRKRRNATRRMDEQKQLTNFLKQAKLLENHERVSGNKGAKKGEFHHAADHALWAIGGNVSAPLCGPNSTDSAKYNSSIYDYEKALALESYETLSQCELNITFKCNTSNIEGYDPAFWAAKIQTCRALVDNYQETSKRCQAATEDGIEQCD